MGENAFLVLITIAIYTKRSLEFTDAELRFGIYLILIGAFLGAFSAFAQIQKLKREKVQEFFEHEEPPLNEEEPIETPVENTKPATDNKPIEPTKNIEEPELFEESQSKPEPDPEVEEIITEDEMIEEIDEVIETVEPEPLEPRGQGDYFTREAGIPDNVSEEKEESKPETESGKGDDKDKANISMNFYEDQ